MHHHFSFFARTWYNLYGPFICFITVHLWIVNFTFSSIQADARGCLVWTLLGCILSSIIIFKVQAVQAFWIWGVLSSYFFDRLFKVQASSKGLADPIENKPEGLIQALFKIVSRIGVRTALMWE